MLESLDSFDWTGIRHVYGKPEKIPAYIRQLLSVRAQERESAMSFLFGGQQDYGDIYESTAHIIPFALEIIADDSSFARTDLLIQLADITSKIYTGGRGEYSIREVRNYLNVYDAIERGMPIYLKLIDAPDKELRAAATFVLGKLSASASSILPVLRDHYANETSENVQVAIIRAIARLLKEQDYIGFDLLSEYQPFFHLIVDNVSNPIIRFEAAKAAITTSISWKRGLRQMTEGYPPALAVALIERYWSLYSEEYSSYERLEIIRLLAFLPDRDALTTLLQHPDTTADDSHTLVRGLLSRYISDQRRDDYWRYEPSWQRSDMRFYEIYSISGSLGIDKTHTQGIWEILRIIANSDKYWDVPTNLLSTMFNLPDNRDMLRFLIENTG